MCELNALESGAETLRAHRIRPTACAVNAKPTRQETANPRYDNRVAKRLAKEKLKVRSVSSHPATINGKNRSKSIAEGVKTMNIKAISANGTVKHISADFSKTSGRSESRGIASLSRSSNQSTTDPITSPNRSGNSVNRQIFNPAMPKRS